MAKKKSAATVNEIIPFAFDREEYNRLCAGAQILVVQMISSNFNVEAEYFDHIEDDDVKLKLDNCVLGAWLTEDKDAVTAIFRYEVKAKYKRKDLVSLRADMLVAYAMPDGVDQENAEAYCQRAGLFAAYPYFRSHFAHINGVASLALPILPVLSSGPVRVAPLGAQLTNNAQEESHERN